MTPAEDGVLFGAPRSILTGILVFAIAAFTFVGPVAPARADSATVTTANDLKEALDRSVEMIALGDTIIVPDTALTVRSDTILLLNSHSLETVGITVNTGTTLTVGGPGDSGSLEARGDGRPGIRTTGATLIINSGTVVVSSDLGHAGIGGAGGSAGSAGGNGGTTIINGGNLAVYGGGAGIGGGRGGGFIDEDTIGDGGNGGVTTIKGGTVTVRGDYGAGIGGGQGGSGVGPSDGGLGGKGGSGGITTITGGQIDAIGGGGAGVGGGAAGLSVGRYLGTSGGHGGSTTITGGQVNAVGEEGAGIGGGGGGHTMSAFGGHGGDGGVVDLQGGTTIAEGTRGAGIGGGDGGLTLTPGDVRLPGYAGGGAPPLTIGVGAQAQAARGDSESTSGNAIGGGVGPVNLGFGSMEVEGELILPTQQRITVPSGKVVTGSGTVNGGGRISNDGVIYPHVDDDVTVTGNSHYVTFDSGTSQVSPRTQVVRVLAPTFDAGDRDFPTAPVITGNPFTGWNTKVDGSGTTPTETTTLSGNPTFYGQWTYDTYALAPDVTAPAVGDAVTFEVTAEDGDPAGDQSADFAFTTDAPGTTFSGNEVTFTSPGDWTVTATHKTIPAILTVPITVTTDRTAATTIGLSLSATTLDADGIITATVTGTDAYGNSLGDLTDLAGISSDETGDTITQGSVGTPAIIHFATPGSRTITAAIGSVTNTADVTVTAEDYTLVADVAAPLAGDTITFSITADDGDPSGDLASDFTFETTGPGTTASGNPVTLTTAGDWTVTATHRESGTQVALDITVGTDRTDPAAIAVTLDSASATVGDTVSATVTGTDAHGNALGDLTDLATITSDHSSDVIAADGSFDVLVPGTHVISADIGGVTDTASLSVTPTPAYYTITPDATSPLAGATVTYTITADNGTPAGDLSAEFTLTTDSAGATVTGNAITFVNAGSATVTATHDTYGTELTLPVTVGTDRTNPAVVTVTLSAFSVKVGGTINVTITGTDAYGNPLGDLTDLATITSDHPTDVIGADGSIRFPTASTHIITAAIGTVSDSAAVTVIPAAVPSATAIPRTGTDPAPATAAAAGLLLLGAAMLTIGRMRRRRP